MRADATAATAVAEEALRPPAHVRGSGRCTVTPVLDRDGRQLLPAGAVAILLYAAANRDPRRFADPHELLPGRAVASHLAFGTGPHRCLGAPLAMLACTAMLRRLAELGPLHTPLTPEAARWGEQFAFGGLVSLPLHVATPAAVAR
ncbi:MAG: cytochrome P450 [Kineosporiaceae bacterium]